MALNPRQAATLDLHRRLDEVLVPGLTHRFISGYQTTHPFVDSYMEGIAGDIGTGSEWGGYSFAQDDLDLISAIRRFHAQADGIDYSEDEILISAGSSSLLMVLMTFLHQSAIRSLYYFPPIYHAVYFLANLLDIDLSPLSQHALWDPEPPPVLPEGQHVLLFADPIWIAGRAVGSGTMNAVRQWQDRTGSTVIVDGTFEYLGWEWPPRREGSTRLVRDRTIRLICPTKSLAVHGIRFAYLLGPVQILKGLRWACDNVTGSASTFDLRAATRIMNVLLSPDRNRHLIAHIRGRYSALRANGFIESTVCEPDCGYYAFGRVSRSKRSDLVMDGRFFELSDLDAFYRINVLSPDIEVCGGGECGLAKV
jgi:aspartate/methionine/tyrosine aminotransferase